MNISKLLGDIYCWFESLFGQNLAEYLWGYNCETGDFSNPNLFNAIGLITIVLTLLFVLAYYYLPLWGFNHPRTNRLRNWLIIFLISGMFNLLFAYLWTENDLLNGNIGECLMYAKDENGNVMQLISKNNLFLFGLSNFFVSSIFFIIFTYIFKWWSPNCRYSHILSIFKKF